MKIYIYQRCDYHGKMTECISSDQLKVIKFLIKDLLFNVGLYLFEEFEHYKKEDEISDDDADIFDPNAILDIAAQCLIGSCQLDMNYLRFNELNIE